MKFGYVSCLPETRLITRFVEELKNGRLMGTKCEKCGAKYLPPRAHCKCGSADIKWYEAPRRGKILTYTPVVVPPESMSKYAPYIVAVVKLEDKTRLLAQLTGVTLNMLRVGMLVQVITRRVGADRIVYEFKLVKVG